MSSILVDDLSNAVGGIGRTVDTAAQLGSGVTVRPFATAIAEGSVTAGACQLQSGVASASGITWTNEGSPVSLSAGAAVALTRPAGAVAFIRAVVTTPVVGGKCSVIITA